MKTKFFDAILEAQKNQRPADQLPPFDLNRLAGGGLAGRIVSRFLENPRWFLSLLRRFRPVAQIGPITVVTRNADVRDILERQDEFQTPFGPEMAEMAKGTNFILGMQDGPQYRQMKSACLSAFPVDEVEKKVRPIAARLAREAMMGAEPGFNPVHDLLKMVPARICRDYFGLVIGDEEQFADWSIALSSLFFADFFGDVTTRELAVSAADAMNKVIARSIEAVRAGQVDPQTPLARLVAIHDADPDRISINGIHSVMMGMVSGFVPTDLLGGGNCLDVILSKPEARRALEEAIAARDDALVDKAIREAMRFKPINIGPLRHVPRDAVVAKGTPHERIIKAGSVVMPATFSAMFDERVVANPETYDISRPESDYILFGHGIHWCIGSLIARVQIAECMKVLFERPNVRRSSGAKGRLKRLGAFPASLHVDFDIPADARTVEHSLLTLVADIPAGTPLAPLRAAVAALGNPAEGPVAEALDRTGCIHFASMAVVCRADPRAERDADPAQLVLELSADGDQDRVLGALAGHAGEMLREVFKAAGLATQDTDMLDLLKRLVIPVGPFPGSNSGLAFAGTPGHSVKRIHAEKALYQQVRAEVRQITADGTLDAWAILAKVRERLSGSSFDWALRPAESHLEKTSKGSWTGALLQASEPRKALAVVGALLLALTLFNHVFLFGAPGSWSLVGIFQAVASFAASMVLGAVGIVVLIAVLALAMRTRLNKMEAADKPDWSLPDLARYEAMVERENRTGAQNHLTGLSVMKAGRLRRFALRLVFFVIRFAAVYVFRPGYLASINTIHFARWVLLPGTDRLLFFSNYGGSWESYLEDFITKANYGLTGVWSNTLGFPRTRDLFFEGATDGDRFKRWARNQQIPTLFWYCAYPGTDTRSIRLHSAVR
ncbi:MAG: cytochrome P450, partial [Notoacmeibacter sp.]|nr:cytochrome P450 [Notoacmeibacter sp.]